MVYLIHIKSESKNYYPHFEVWLRLRTLVNLEGIPFPCSPVSPFGLILFIASCDVVRKWLKSASNPWDRAINSH